MGAPITLSSPKDIVNGVKQIKFQRGSWINILVVLNLFIDYLY